MRVFFRYFEAVWLGALLSAFTTSAHADLSAGEVSTLLAQHNQVRSGVTPTAANMARLTWDPSLQAVAQAYANQCNFNHNGQRNSQYAALSANSGQVGENIYVTSSPNRASALTGANNAVTLWANEVGSYNYSTNTCASGQVCGHYTQLVWANTLRVGCGIAQCPSIVGVPSTFNNGHIVVCDYNPAGNFIGQSPYVSGVTGSQCPSNLPNVVDGLCSPATALPNAVIPTMPVGLGALFGVALAGLGWRRVRSKRAG